VIDPDPGLVQAAFDFAASLTRRTRAVIGDHVDPFVAKAIASGLVTVRQEPRVGVELCVRGEPTIRLVAQYFCEWDHRSAYLAVAKSDFRISAVSAPSEPLFRVEYERGASGPAPVAHIQVHAHRDEWEDALMGCGTASNRGRRRADLAARGEAVPRLSQVHFSLGGHRFRPCLEDILEMLLDEFGVDRQPNALAHLADGRQEWRTTQVAAAVRDAPEVAARVLDELGYSVARPEDGPAHDRVDRLRQY
jgi:hypothetical protein